MKRRNAIGMFVGGLYAAVGLKFSDPAKIREKKKPHCKCCQVDELFRESGEKIEGLMKKKVTKNAYWGKINESKFPKQLVKVS